MYYGILKEMPGKKKKISDQKRRKAHSRNLFCGPLKRKGGNNDENDFPLVRQRN